MRPKWPGLRLAAVQPSPGRQAGEANEALKHVTNHIRQIPRGSGSPGDWA